MRQRGSRCRESPPLGLFTQDLLKPSIRLEEDTLTLAPGASPGEGGPVSIPGTPSGEDGLVPISGDSPRASVGHITPDLGQAEELVAVVGPPSPKTD
jgi:hypothetical protein